MQVPDWYVHVDLKALKQSFLMKQATVNDQQLPVMINEIVGKRLNDNAEFLSFRGFMDETKGQVVLLKGNFSEPSVKKELQELIADIGFRPLGNGVYRAEEKDFEAFAIKTKDRLRAKKLVTITDDESMEIDVELTKERESKVKEVFAGFQSDNVLVFSNRQAQIKHYLASQSEWNPTSQSQVFEVVVDVQKSLMHGGVNIDESAQNFEFESISAKQLSQVSGTYKEREGMIDIEVGLQTDSLETAGKIEAVAKGLIALKMLSGSSQELNQLLSSIVFEREVDSLKILLSGPVESFEAIRKEI